MYLPLKRDKHAALESLFACLDEVKTFFSHFFFFLNESKTEVIVFGPSESSGSKYRSGLPCSFYFFLY